ncbi:hypothetical protein C0995_001563 [Termitomyces sp. Mi166|nr:hypothetical protein C0995_001563 [Termitomyces sp. Mi166\
MAFTALRRLSRPIHRLLSTQTNTRTYAKAKIAEIDALSPFSPSLIDSYGRKHDYLRFYCMPSEGVELSPNGNILTNDEVIRLATLFVKSGVTKIRLTGGEPTVRKGIEELIGRLNKLRPLGLKSIAMTSNGLVLYRRLPKLIENGLTHLNLRSPHLLYIAAFTDHFYSLDTLDPFTFELITRRRGHEAVLKALDVALTSSLQSVKLNVVVIRGINDSEIVEFVKMTKDNALSVCLFDAKELSLRDEMRKGASDEELLHVIGDAVSGKKEKHAGMEDIDVVTNRPMILIGYLNTRQPPLAVKHRSNKPMSSTVLLARSHNLTPTPHTILASLHTMPTLSHIDREGRAYMVDIVDKQPTKRTATASGRIYIPPVAYELVTSTYQVVDMSEPVSHEEKAKIKAGRKGDALTVAQLAAIMGAKKTSDLIPLCHPLSLTKVAVTLTPTTSEKENGTVRYYILCEATVSTEGKTGVEMEALTAVSVGLLTVWDMLKAVAGREMNIGEIKVTRKSGGRSGDFIRNT